MTNNSLFADLPQTKFWNSSQALNLSTRFNPFMKSLPKTSDGYYFGYLRAFTVFFISHNYYRDEKYASGLQTPVFIKCIYTCTYIRPEAHNMGSVIYNINNNFIAHTQIIVRM